MIFVADDQTSEVVQPREKPFDFPTALVSPQRPAVLRRGPAAIPLMWGHQFDAALVEQPFVQRVAVIRFVADKVVGKSRRPRLIERFLDQRHFVRRSAGHVDCDRKTSAVCNGHDLAAFAPFRLSDAFAPFFAPAKVPSMKASDRSRPPRCSRSSASVVRIFLKTLARVHCWNRRWHVWYGGYRSGRSFQGAPVRNTHKIPLSTSRASRGGRPRPPRLPLRRRYQLDELRIVAAGGSGQQDAQPIADVGTDHRHRTRS